MATSDEEGPPELLLQLVHLLGEGRLAHVERPGSPAEMTLLGQHLERAQEADLHRR